MDIFNSPVQPDGSPHYRIADFAHPGDGTARTAMADLAERLHDAVVRVQLANAAGDPILSAWLPDARAALRQAWRGLPERPSGNAGETEQDARDRALQASCPVLAVPRFGELPPMGNGQRVLIAANGLFVQVRLDWLDCIQQLAPATGVPLPYGAMQERMVFAFGRLPIRLMEQFVAAARERLPNETAGALVYSRARADLRLVVHPPLSASPGHVTYGLPAMAADESLAVDLHTHGRLPAFWSPTDDRDDTGIKIAGVFGDLHRQRPSAEFRLVLNGTFRALPHPWQSTVSAMAPASVEGGVVRRILAMIRGQRRS